MTTPPKALGACIVLHDPRTVGALAAALRSLEQRVGVPLRCLVFLSRRSPAEVEAVRRHLESAGLAVDHCARSDDTFLDFSMYAAGLAQLSAHAVEDAIFVNDTLVSRHGSGYLQRIFADRVRRVRSERFGFPVMVGPHSRSEYSFGDRRHDEFVSTYLFHLNGPALAELARVVANLESVQMRLRGLRAGDSLIQADEIERLCLVHATQLVRRYEGMSDSGDRLVCKLVTVHAERSLADAVRRRGLVWYIGNGLVGRILIPAQSWWASRRFAGGA